MVNTADEEQERQERPSPTVTPPPITAQPEEDGSATPDGSLPDDQRPQRPQQPWHHAVDEDPGGEDEPAVAEPFLRTMTPNSNPSPSSADANFPDRPSCSMHKFTLYETAGWYYIVGSDVTETRYRVLKIDRTAESGCLAITDDKTVYSQKEIIHLLDAIDDGNKGTGGAKLRCTTWGLLGFVKFTGPYYMLLITKKSTVAMLGGHYVYQVDGTELIPLTTGRPKPDMRNNVEESRFLSILNNLDLTRSFYYSYSYDITRTLQRNLTRERDALAEGRSAARLDDLNSMFVWNSHLLQPALDSLKDPYVWCRPIIHGYMDQSAISIFGRSVFITIIARRSRFFAGARFLKRGANDLGYVANDVETEQIVSDSLTTSFHAPGPRLFCSPHYTSYVQHRGSIPLYWTQDNTGVTPKPPIELNLVDPFYSAAALHFDNLFERYGAPIYVLNLVKGQERTPRESKLLEEFTNAICYLKQFLPEGRAIIYRAWDMSRAAKRRDQDVIATLEAIAESVVTATGFFHNGDGKTSRTQGQNGVARTNCIDCLDRTNAAQFVIGKRALGHQLHALGVLDDTAVEYDTDAVNLFTHMYHDHGDSIAVQYGGSQLVNTMETYRKINQWTSHSRDMIESFRRYYNNSFLDGQRQEAYNLFLGNYIFTQGQPMLWDLATDYYLHHTDPRTWSQRVKPDYMHWFTPAYLEQQKLPPHVSIPRQAQPPFRQDVGSFDDYWLEYYRPSTLSSFPKMFLYKMNSTIKYIPFLFKPAQDTWHHLSPFVVRTDGDLDVQEKRKAKKEVMVIDPQNPSRASADKVNPDRRGVYIHRWLQQPVEEKFPAKGGGNAGAAGFIPKASDVEKAKVLYRSFAKAAHESLHPSVSRQEADDYGQYVRHPQNLPLVVSAENPADFDAEYEEYIHGAWRQDGLAPRGTEDEIGAYADLLKIGDNPLTVVEGDTQKKRYKAYRKWLSGKPLFKQHPVDIGMAVGLSEADLLE